jgi:hypothetical protein
MSVKEELASIIHPVLTGDAHPLLEALGRAVTGLYQHWARRRIQGIYEALEHDTVVELKDPNGRVATVDRQEEVRFLQDNVVAFADYAWGDGQIFAEYRCSPGVPDDRYANGSRHTVLISLRETKNRGDTLRFTIHRKVRRGFTRRDEWWETEVYHKTQRLRIAVIFPRKRHCQRAMVTQGSTSKAVALGAQHFSSCPMAGRS